MSFEDGGCGILSTASKGRWWSVTASFGAILRHREELACFLDYLIDGKCGTPTYRAIANEAKTWIMNAKVLCDVQFIFDW